MLQTDDGEEAFQVMVRGFPNGISKEQDADICDRIIGAFNDTAALSTRSAAVDVEAHEDRWMYGIQSVIAKPLGTRQEIINGLVLLCEHQASNRAALRQALAGAAHGVDGWQPIDKWHEEIGDAFWTRFPVQEPYYAGSPLCEDWPEGYYTHFIPMSVFNHLLDKNGMPVTALTAAQQGDGVKS